MKSDILINQAKKIPEIETELTWYLNLYQNSDSHPWEKIIENVFINFNIKLPILNNSFSSKQLIGLTIIIQDFKLMQGNVPGTYHLFVEGVGYLDELDDIQKYIFYSFVKLLLKCYEANEKNELDKLEKSFHLEIQKWNWHPWVKQEEVIFLFGNQIKVISDKVSIPERKIHEVLADYYSRMDQKRLENLYSFIEKSESLLNSSFQVKKQVNFFSTIIEELKNGGQNLRSEIDIIPHYSGIKFS